MNGFTFCFHFVISSGCLVLLLTRTPLVFFAIKFQKGTYNIEEKVIQLQSELVGNASKVI